MRLHKTRKGFSLIELVIVVMIIGIIGAIAIPRLSRGSEGAKINAFVAELDNFAKAIQMYQAQTGNRVLDSSSGTFPTDLGDYLHQNSWEGETPIGGLWDIEVDGVGGHSLSVGVHFMGVSVDTDAVQQVDEAMDDGNLATGAFQKIASDRYYLIPEN